MSARGPKGIARAVTRKVTTETRVEFDATELRRRLRLPEDATLFVRTFDHEGAEDIRLDLDRVPVIATWTVSK